VVCSWPVDGDGPFTPSFSPSGPYPEKVSARIFEEATLHMDES